MNDEDVNTAYLLFKKKGWKPTDYYSMGQGERLVTRSFIQKEIDDEIERQKELERSRR